MSGAGGAGLRTRLRRRRRVLVAAAAVAGLAAVALAIRTAVADASPLPPAGALYVATVAYGLGSMMELRERALFAPGGRRVESPALRWWIPRVLLVLLAASLPPVMLLGGLVALP